MLADVVAIIGELKYHIHNHVYSSKFSKMCEMSGDETLCCSVCPGQAPTPG